MWAGIILLGGLGIVAGVGLAAAAKKFAVKEDPMVVRLLEELPSVNCGACGFASCRDYAERLAHGEVQLGACAPGGADTVQVLAGILGVAAPEVGARCAVVHCGGTSTAQKDAGRYSGVDSCAADDALGGGHVACGYGCLGRGDCRAACPFEAIEMADGLPGVIIERCTACGKCVKACPRNLITVESFSPESGLVAVACSSLDRGKAVRQACKVGCIACKRCEKDGPEGMFKVTGNLARVDPDCFPDVPACAAAIEKCPASCIVSAVASRREAAVPAGSTG